MALKFDVNGFTNEVLNQLESEIAYAFYAWENEVKSKVTHRIIWRS